MLYEEILKYKAICDHTNFHAVRPPAFIDHLEEMPIEIFTTHGTKIEVFAFEHPMKIADAQGKKIRNDAMCMIYAHHKGRRVYEYRTQGYIPHEIFITRILDEITHVLNLESHLT